LYVCTLRRAKQAKFEKKKRWKNKENKNKTFKQRVGKVVWTTKAKQKKRKIQKRKMTDEGDDWDEFLTRSAVVCIRTHLLLFLEKSSPRERERVNPEQSVSPIRYSVFVT